MVHPVKGIGGPDAVWTSKVLDAGLRARFGKITWEATGPLQISTRTGNTKDPDDTWSAWSAGFSAPTLIDSPAARYLQVRARFDKDPNAVLSEIGVSFLTDNLRAVITSVDAKDSGPAPTATTRFTLRRPGHAQGRVDDRFVVEGRQPGQGRSALPVAVSPSR